MDPKVKESLLSRNPDLAARFAAAEDEASQRQMAASLTRGGDIIASAGSIAAGRPAPLDEAGYQANMQAAGAPVRNLVRQVEAEQSQQQAEFSQDMQQKKFDMDQEVQELAVTKARTELEYADPSSEINRKFQEKIKPMLKRMNLEGLSPYLTMKDLSQGHSFLQMVHSAQSRRAELEEKYEQMLERDERKLARDKELIREKARHGAYAKGGVGLNDEGIRMVRDMRKEGILNVMNAFGEIDKEIDLGAGDKDVPGLGRVMNMVPDAIAVEAESLGRWINNQPALTAAEKEKIINVRSNVKKMQNVILKLRSGGAVSDPEADRLLNELALKPGMSAQQIRTSLSNVRKDISSILRTVGAVDPKARQVMVEAAGYDPEASEREETQGSATVRLRNKKTGKTAVGPRSGLQDGKAPAGWEIVE